MEQNLVEETKEQLLTIADTLYQGGVSDGIAAMNAFQLWKMRTEP